MNQPIPDAEPIPDLEAIWPRIQAVRLELATELEQMKGDFPGLAGVRLNRVAGWFRGPADFDDAIRWPDVTAVGLAFLEPDCRPFCAGSPDGPSGGQSVEHSPAGPLAEAGTTWTPAQISHAARLGASSLVPRPYSGGQQYWQVLLYPLTVLVAAWLLWVGFSFWVSPQFEEMFLDFGIELALITKALLGLSALVRRWWLLMVAVPIACGLAFWSWQRILARRQTHSPGLEFRFPASRRDSVAIWAWHLSLLLESGVAEQRAVATVGEATGNSWLRRRSRAWTNPASPAPPDSGSLPATGLPRVFSFNPEFQLVTAVMALPVSAAKVAMLQELSAYNWERGFGSGAWWIQWLSMLMKFFLFIMIFLLVFSLFSPLISLIGGLSRH